MAIAGCSAGDAAASVCIVEDHLLLAESLVLGLRGKGIAAGVVPAGACSAFQLLSELATRGPSLVLLDLDLGAACDGPSLVRPLVDAGVRVLVVTGTEDRLRIAAALEAGALGYQPKAAGFGALLAATTDALTCDGPLDPAGRSALLAELAASREASAVALEPFQQLTEREAAALRSLGDGRCARQIAADWVVSEATVRTHIRGVLTKVGATSQLEAVAAASRAGWLGVHA